MEKILLFDRYSPTDYQIVEGRTAENRMRVAGKVQHAGVQNLNKRFYPRHVLEREVSRLQPLLAEKAVIGELDHPEDGKTKLYRASHVWTDLKIDDKGVVEGTAEILNTPRGLILQELFSSIKVGASSRGQGSVNAKTGEVQEDYQMDTIDMVYRPSTPGAFPQLIREEVNTLESLVEDADLGFRRLSDLRKLVTEQHAGWQALSKQGKIELGAELMQGEFVCNRLLAVPELQSAATETYGVARELRKRIEEDLGITCSDDGHCTLSEMTASPRGLSMVTPPILSPTATEYSKPIVDQGEDEDATNETDEENDSGGEDSMPDLKGLQAELTAVREAVEHSNSEIERLRPFERKFETASKIIEGMKSKYTEAQEQTQAAQDRSEATEALLREATHRLERLETTQSAGLRRRLEKSEELIAALAQRVQESGNDEVLAAAEELGEELLQRLAEAHQRAEAAEALLEATVECVQEDVMSSELEHLLEDDPQAERLRPLLEDANVGSIDELRAQYARLKALRSERRDTTLPLSESRARTPAKGGRKVKPLTEDTKMARSVAMSLALEKKIRSGSVK